MTYRVGTVNPFLTFLLVLLFLGLVIVIVVLGCLLHRARADRLAAIGEVEHRTRQHKSAQDRATVAERRAGEAEGHARRLFELLQGAQATLREAVNHEDQLLIIARNTGELLAMHDHVLPDGGTGLYVLPNGPGG